MWLFTVARLYILVHHLNTTALHETKVIVLGGSTLPTGPAELILAVCAGHMIAALVFFDTAFANGALRHIVLVLLGPLAKLFVHSVCA